ncbi:DNA polymerase Y family protein, partial [Achromobacter spanius]
MRLWIAACLRCLPLDAIRPHWPHEQEAFAVLDQERVAALTPAARRAGVTPGMRRAGAAAIAPDVELQPRNAQAEAEALQGAALALLQYTPEIALADGDTVLLNVGASLMFFRGPRALSRRVAATLRALDLRATLGMAPTAAGAWLLAHRAGRGVPRRTLK